MCDGPIAAWPAPFVEDRQGHSTPACFRLPLPLHPACGTHNMALDEAILEATVSGEWRMMASLASRHLRTLRGRTPSRPERSAGQTCAARAGEPPGASRTSSPWNPKPSRVSSTETSGSLLPRHRRQSPLDLWKVRLGVVVDVDFDDLGGRVGLPLPESSVGSFLG